MGGGSWPAQPLASSLSSNHHEPSLAKSQFTLYGAVMGPCEVKRGPRTRRCSTSVNPGPAALALPGCGPQEMPLPETGGQGTCVSFPETPCLTQPDTGQVLDKSIEQMKQTRQVAEAPTPPQGLCLACCLCSLSPPASGGKGPWVSGSGGRRPLPSWSSGLNVFLFLTKDSVRLLSTDCTPGAMPHSCLHSLTYASQRPHGERAASIFSF